MQSLSLNKRRSKYNVVLCHIITNLPITNFLLSSLPYPSRQPFRHGVVHWTRDFALTPTPSKTLLECMGDPLLLEHIEPALAASFATIALRIEEKRLARQARWDAEEALAALEPARKEVKTRVSVTILHAFIHQLLLHSL